MPRRSKSYSPKAFSYIVSLSDTESDIEVIDDVESFCVDFDSTIHRLWIECNPTAPPTGADLIVDVVHDSEVIATLTIPAGDAASPDYRDMSKFQFVERDHLRFDIKQVGSTTTGKRLKVHIVGAFN